MAVKETTGVGVELTRLILEKVYQHPAISVGLGVLGSAGVQTAVIDPMLGKINLILARMLAISTMWAASRMLESYTKANPDSREARAIRWLQLGTALYGFMCLVLSSEKTTENSAEASLRRTSNKTTDLFLAFKNALLKFF